MKRKRKKKKPPDVHTLPARQDKNCSTCSVGRMVSESASTYISVHCLTTTECYFCFTLRLSTNHFYILHVLFGTIYQQTRHTKGKTRVLTLASSSTSPSLSRMMMDIQDIKEEDCFILTSRWSHTYQAMSTRSGSLKNMLTVKKSVEIVLTTLEESCGPSPDLNCVW